MKYLLLTIIWILFALVANPIGEFPLNDDWAYGKDVLLLLTTGKLEFVDWSAMSLASQIFLGAAVCKLFGFSFTILRILTLAIGLVGILTSYKIFKNLTANNKLSFYCSLLIAGNPLYFSLSYTFMTDVYFYTFSILSFYFLHQSLITGKIMQILLGSVFVVLAVFVRQIGIVIPISFAIAFFFKTQSFSLPNSVKALFPTILSGFLLFLYSKWITASHGNVTSYFSFEKTVSELGLKTFEHIFYRIGTSGMTLGLFIFPILILTVPDVIKNFKLKENRFIVLFTVLFSIPLVRAWGNIPLGNIFFNFGIGPRLLRDSSILNINNHPAISNFTLNSIRVICFVGAILLFYQIFNFLFNLNKYKTPYALSESVNIRLMSMIYSILLFGTFVIPSFFFDRYLIQLLFPLIIVILPAIKEINFRDKTPAFAIIIIFIFSTFSVLATHDYLAWNRARWQGLNYLVNDLKKAPNMIDGGFEFNGWYQSAPINSSENKSWWFVDNDKYILTFGPIQNFTILKAFPYTQYIPFEKRNIYILTKD
jgi:hypothetical protein